MQVKISSVHIGKRLRQDDGDMESLAESIREFGLIHPIVVDDKYNLVAGCRRLLACERLGWEEIPVTMLSDLSEKELRILELEENIRRKDLTPIENSRRLVELAELKERELQEQANNEKSSPQHEKEVLAESAKTQNLGGRPPKGNTPLEKISNEIGIPRKTILDARQHVAAVEAHPELENLPKYKAIEEAKKLDAKVIDFGKAYDRQVEADSREYQKFHEMVYAPLVYRLDDNVLSSVIRAAPSLTDEIQTIDRAIAKLSELKEKLILRRSSSGKEQIS